MRSNWNVEPQKFRGKWSATVYIIAALIGCFLLTFFFSGSQSNPIWEGLAYTTDLSKPWTLFTYPFATPLGGVFFFAISCWIIYQFMSDLERRMGAWGITLFFFTMALLGGLGYFIGTIVAAGPSAYQPKLSLIIEVIIFTWALLNWGSTIKLFMIIPVPCSVIVYLSIASVVIEHGIGSPLVGVFTALPLLVSWLYVTNRIAFMPFGKVPDVAGVKEKKKDDREFNDYMDKVREKEQDRNEKEKLRKMLESSLSEDDKDEPKS